jgi:AraC-like DNA-binding protein
VTAQAAARRSQVACAIGVRLELIGSLRSAGPWSGVNHRHAFWELLWYRAGSGEFRCAGQRHAVRDGRIFLVAPGERHQLATAGRLEHVYLGFTWDGRSPAARRLAELPLLPDPVAAPLHRHLDALWRRVDGDVERAGAVDGLLPRLHELATWLQEGGSEASDAPDTVVRQAQAYLAANVDRTVTVRELAASCYLSPGHLGERFAQATGQTIKAYHAELRLRRAAELLRQSAAGVHEVARILGFGDAAYLTRLFKRRFGMPPSRYRAAR